MSIDVSKIGFTGNTTLFFFFKVYANHLIKYGVSNVCPKRKK